MNDVSKKPIFNSLRPRQNGRHFADDTFKCIFTNENVWNSFKTSLKFVPWGPINNIPALVQIMVWRRPGEPMLIRLPTHICVTRPQWVNTWMINQYILTYSSLIYPSASCTYIFCGPELYNPIFIVDFATKQLPYRRSQPCTCEITFLINQNSDSYQPCGTNICPKIPINIVQAITIKTWTVVRYHDISLQLATIGDGVT